MSQGVKVSQLVKLLGVSNVTIYRKLKRLEKQLEGETYKENGILFLLPEAVEIIKKSVETNNPNISKRNESDTSTGCRTGSSTGVEQVLKSQIIQLEKQLTRKDQELDRKDGTINKQDETIKQLIDRQAESEEKLQTIIMKLTQDLEQTRKLIDDKSVSEEKEKSKKEKESNKSTDRVISIQEFIAAKIEEDIERSNFEAEKRKLKQKHNDPLQGRSALYKIYVKMFRPDKLRMSV